MGKHLGATRLQFAFSSSSFTVWDLQFGLDFELDFDFDSLSELCEIP